MEMVGSHGDVQVTWRWSGHNEVFWVTVGTIFIGLAATLLDPSQDGRPFLWAAEAGSGR